MTSRSSGPARCKHKSSAPCSSCRYEQQTKDTGTWVEDPPGTQPVRKISTDYRSFSRERKYYSITTESAMTTTFSWLTNPAALRTSTKNTTQTQTQTKKTTQQPKPSSNSNSSSSKHHERPYKNHPSLAPSTLTHRKKATTPTSSLIATRGGSPVTQHAIPAAAHNPRQTLPATTNAGAVARGHPRAMTPQEASQVRAHLERMQNAARNECEESETDSDDQSENSSDDDDDE